MTQPSVLYRLIDKELDGKFAEFVAARWPAKSFREIAEEVEAQTGITVNMETLRLWFSGRLQPYSRLIDQPTSTRGAA